MQPYPLASSYFGVEHAAVLDHPCTATALGIPQLADAPVTVTVTLKPRPQGGWLVDSPLGYLGWLTAGEAAEYPQLKALNTRGFIPTAPASIEIVDGALEVAVVLGLAPWQVPVNDPAAPVLTGGYGYLLDASKSSDVDEAALNSLGWCQFFVTLRAIDQAVLALADDRVIGTIHSPELTRVVANAGPLSARAFAAGGHVAVDLPASSAESAIVPTYRVPALGRTQVFPEAPAPVTSTPTWDFTPEDFEPSAPPAGSRRGFGSDQVSYREPEQLPGLPTQTFQAVDFPTGTFATAERTTPSGRAPAPAPAPEPRTEPQSSQLSQPSQSAPSADGFVSVSELAEKLSKQESMTRQFRALSTDFQSDSAVAQVYARRQARPKRHGHHRR